MRISEIILFIASDLTIYHLLSTFVMEISTDSSVVSAPDDCFLRAEVSEAPGSASGFLSRLSIASSRAAWTSHKSNKDEKTKQEEETEKPEPGQYI